MLKSADADGDQALSAEEQQSFIDELRTRTTESRASVAGTVVYGVAVVEGGFLVRTGSHLFRIGE